MTTLLNLFFEFLLIGLFAIGGGLATLPFLNELGERTGWFTSMELANMLAVSEATPGPIGINMATYVGYEVGGILGGALATIGLILPSLIIALVIYKVFTKFEENRFVEGAMYGLRPASIALVAVALIYVIGSTFFYKAPDIYDLLNISINYKAVILFAIVFIFAILIKKTSKIHPIFYIFISAVVGIVFQFSI